MTENDNQNDNEDRQERSPGPRSVWANPHERALIMAFLAGRRGALQEIDPHLTSLEGKVESLKEEIEP